MRHAELIAEAMEYTEYLRLSMQDQAAEYIESLCDVIAALQAEPLPMTDAPVEVGWLIECRVDPTAPYWLTADNTNTNDANEALRFARKIDADGFLKVFLTAHFGDDTFGIYKRHFSPEKYSVTEHMFIDIKPKGE